MFSRGDVFVYNNPSNVNVMLTPTQYSTPLSLWHVAGILIVSASCVSPDHPAANSRDSSGISIITNSARPQATMNAWGISEKPILEIGGLEGDERYQLDDVAGTIALSENALVVANGATRELRFFDRQGRYLRSSGQRGSGPGEFESLNWLAALPGDSLITYDRQLNRISVFTSAGEFVRSFVFAQPTATPAGVFSDGSLLDAGGHAFKPSEQSGVYRDSVEYRRYTTTGVQVQLLGKFPSSEYFVHSEGGIFTVMPRAFGRSTKRAVADSAFYVGPSDRYEIVVYGLDGRPIKIIRRAFQNSPVKHDDITAHREQALESESQQSRPYIRKVLDAMPYPETMPAYSAIHLDSRGYLWVADYRRPLQEALTWSIFDDKGILVNSVTTPVMIVHQIGEDFVLGVVRDEDHIQRVRIYRLSRAGQPER